MKLLNKEKENIRSMFDSIAHRYDLLNHLLSAGIDKRWRRELVLRTTRQNPTIILDVATGTGDLAIALAQGNKQAKIVGVDLSEGMLAVGERKIVEKKLTNRITLTQADVMEMGYSDNAFDVVTVAFGVRNFEDLLGGLEQMYRVLRTEGKLYVLELSIPQGWFLKNGYRFYFNVILPIVGRLTSKVSAAYRYLPESVGAFPAGESFCDFLYRAGFKQASSTSLTGGIATLYEATK